MLLVLTDGSMKQPKQLPKFSNTFTRCNWRGRSASSFFFRRKKIMPENLRLGGENIKPKTAKEARALIGKTVKYLQKSDIDKSGRGYFFPQVGTIAGVLRKEIAMDSPSNFIVSISNLVEMKLIDDE
jgi:hypothetical protein